jgi:CheY-like chemotaxis protein
MDPLKKPRLLLIDDEKGILTVIQRMLSKDGFEVIALATPEEALDVISRGTPVDVVLCDHSMPGMTGPELRDAAAVWAPGLAKRFVWMTGDNTRSKEPALQKPFTRAEVSAAINEALQRAVD